MGKGNIDPLLIIFIIALILFLLIYFNVIDISHIARVIGGKS